MVSQLTESTYEETIFSRSSINAIHGGKPLQAAPVSAFLHTVRYP
jgi:hypothetical protein